MSRPRVKIAPALVLALGLAIAASAAVVARAALAVAPDEIQEDWQLVIGLPDPAGYGPQVSTFMSPVSDNSTPFFIFNLNYRDSPSFASGGLQAESWSGETLLASDAQGSAQCNTQGETITWTQDMKLSSGQVNFAINSGRSTTWGKFGQGQQLNLSGLSFGTSLTSLSGYTPAASVAGSGVGWQRNRVTSMTLLRVRYYAAGKLLSTDTNARQVDLTR